VRLPGRRLHDLGDGGALLETDRTWACLVSARASGPTLSRQARGVGS
jgi:hypothetical protein